MKVVHQCRSSPARGGSMEIVKPKQSHVSNDFKKGQQLQEGTTTSVKKGRPSGSKSKKVQEERRTPNLRSKAVGTRI
jgi:hypothetical protein